jgi:hypothetical protein
MENTCTLSVSSEKIKDCNSIVSALSEAGIQCSVTHNTSIQCESGKCWIERGCRIVRSVSGKHEVTKMWDVLKETCAFQCAHLSIPGNFQGCILDYTRPSLCSGKIKIKTKKKNETCKK